jgi:hypothetical protein
MYDLFFFFSFFYPSGVSDFALMDGSRVSFLSCLLAVASSCFLVLGFLDGMDNLGIFTSLPALPFLAFPFPALRPSFLITPGSEFLLTSSSAYVMTACINANP